MELTLPAIPKEYLEITFLDEIETENSGQNYKQILPFGVSEIYSASVESAKYLSYGEDVKSIAEVCLNIQDSDFNYEPGQTIGILPQNDVEEVNHIIERLKLTENAQKLYKISIKTDCTKKNAKIPVHIPQISTIRKTLTHHVDIRSVPKKLFLRALTKYTTDPSEVNILNELCSTQGMTKYNNFVTNYITLLELLKTFKSCYPPFSSLLEHLPKLHPRPYSISSSPYDMSPTCSKLKFVYSLEMLPHSLKGVCTGWLNNELEGFLENRGHLNKHIPVYLRKANDFKLPDELATNIIMIAAGTGLAPFIGFLNHRKQQIHNNKDLIFGKMILFFGCRFSDKDFIFKEEIQNFVETGVLTKLFVSFSREKNSVKYVQDNIKMYEKEFVELLSNNCNIYVCGNGNMRKDVIDTIINCLCNVRGYTNEEGKQEMNELKTQKKYIEDIWT